MRSKQHRIQQERDDAWIGDAVLALYARTWILENGHQFPQDKTELFRHMTSNQFLSALGQPTSVEAKIGVLYQESGYSAAKDWMEENILPLFLKQMRNRQLHLN
ncbi:MAG: ribonuclease III domain-containing protein [Verrucomicrobiota bacterium]